jgi:hypothetical protein
MEAIGIFSKELNQLFTDRELRYPEPPLWAENSQDFDRQREHLKRNLAHWFGVKLFDIIHENELYAIVDLKNINDENEEALQWPTRIWTVFQNAAHITSGRRKHSYYLTDEGDKTKELKSLYLSSAWYQLQLVLTPGWRIGGQVNPNDFSYNLQHLHKLAKVTGQKEPIRFFQNYLKAAEQRNNGITPINSVKTSLVGWNMRELSPWRLWSDGRGSTLLFDDLSAALLSDLREVFVNATVTVLESFEDKDWPRTTYHFTPRTDFHLEDRNTVPVNGWAFGNPDCIFYDRRTQGGCRDSNDAVEIDTIYTLLILLSKNKAVSEPTFNKLRNWAIKSWDYSEWPNFN